MATLQVRDIDDGLYDILKSFAQKEHRSLSQEVVNILESYVQNPQHRISNTTEEFLSLCDAWKDNRSADEIINDVMSHRKNSPRFGAGDGIFD